jgi:hypothetical protein
MIKKYRKKPVEIEAILWDGKMETVDEIEEWSDGGTFVFTDRGSHIVLMIVTPEGDMRATVGDFIIKGSAGEMYPCKPDVFETVYGATEE